MPESLALAREMKTKLLSGAPGWLAAWLAVALSVAGAGAGQPSAQKADPSDQFFADQAVRRLRIRITGTNLAALRQNNREYVRATVREGDEVYPEVGVHLKGAAGSFRELADRPALTLNFDKFKQGQKFHGLDKLHLNNSVQDPSYMTELICGELFLAAGVPAARATYARVELNGRDLGFYVLKEGFDKTFLRRHFVNPNGNLYDGGFLKEITDGLQKTSGEGGEDRADLKRLAEAASDPDPVKRMERLEKVLDVDRFLSFVALEVMTHHWDGYALKRNNYRVYHDPATGKMVFFPHGMDQMFWVADAPILPGMDGLVARAVTTSPEGRRRYRERVSSLFTNLFQAAVLTNRIHELQARIRPALAQIQPDAAQNHDGAVDHLRDEILLRIRGLDRLLNTPEPKPLKFDGQGLASVSGWRVHNVFGLGELSQDKEAENRPTLRIRAAADPRAGGSWRARVLLEPGQYRFEGELRTQGVVPTTDRRGTGAGLRISRLPRPAQLSGDSPWTKVFFDFSVDAESQGTELVCELRATQGEAWFDLNSLKLVREGK